MLGGISLQIRSLRGRYTAIAVGLALAIVISTLAGNYGVVTTREASSFNLKYRASVVQESRRVRDFLWQAQRQLEAYLRDPTQDGKRAQFHRALASAFLTVEELRHNPWVERNQNATIFSRLQELLQQLIDRGEALMQLRNNPVQQYPGFSIATTQLYDSTRRFSSAVDAAILETDTDAGGKDSFEIYREFSTARYFWAQMISSFRIYLANRMGSFDSVALKNQQHDTLVFLDGVKNQLRVLEKYQRAGKLGMISEDSLSAMRESARAWKTYYDSIIRINSSDHWRTDTRYMEDFVAPLLNDIWSMLLSNDVLLEKMSEGDVDNVSSLALDQNRVLWILAFLGLIFLGVGFLFLDRSVLQPMARVAAAMNLEAKGEAGVSLPNLRTMETENLVGAFHEMQRQVRVRQEKLEYLAMHDSLTGLPNRALFLDRLNQIILRAQREELTPAILMLDLDRFKEINDTLGHSVGDAFLFQVGSRLTEGLRKSDTVARLGGDEFAIILNHVTLEQAEAVAEKIRASFKEIFRVNTHSFYAGCSIGIAHYPTHGEGASLLMQCADIAMYVSKRNRSPYEVFDQKRHGEERNYLSLYSDLKSAIEKDLLYLYFQPQLDYSKNRFYGAEALLRWRHAELGNIAPNKIVDLAEQRGLINPLTEWVIEHAVATAVVWQREDEEIRVSVNLSPYNFQDMGLVERVSRILEKYSFPSRCLLLEVTENAMMSNPQLAIDQLNNLAKLGVYCAIDDYGSGYSSLSYIKKLPVKELKIDKSFIQNLSRDENDVLIVRSTIELAHHLGLRVVAEGVEEKAEDDMLRSYGCDFVQGYFHGKPMSSTEFENLLQASRNA